MVENHTEVYELVSDKWTMMPSAAGVPVDPEVYMVGLVLGMVLNSIGIFGNLLVITAIWLSKRLRKVHNAFMASLAGCDLGAILFGNVLQLAALGAKGWPFNFGACVLQNMATFHFNVASMVHVVVIAVYRYLAVEYPHGNLAVQRKSYVLAILIILHVLILASTVLAKLPRINTMYFNDHVAMCMETGMETARGFLCTMSVIVMVTTITLLVVYHLIRFRIKHSPAMPTMLNIARKKSHLSILVCMGVVVMLVALGYTPITIMFGLQIHGMEIPKAVLLPAICLMWVANSTNWIIYGALNRDFRLAYKLLLSRRRGVRIQPSVAVVAWSPPV